MIKIFPFNLAETLNLQVPAQIKVVQSIEIKAMEFPRHNTSNSPFCNYPYNLYSYPFLNSSYNCFSYGQSGNQAYDSSFNFPSLSFPTHQSFNSMLEEPRYNAKVTENTVIQKVVAKEEETEFKPYLQRNQAPRSPIRPNNMQKENRNVASNLLRIFFKSILEVGKYDAMIEAIIRKYRIVHSAQDFKTWLEGFKVNYKNYIKPTEITKIMTRRHSQDYQKIFTILLRNYMKDAGMSHCLTSKRIHHDTMFKHLKGLRVLSDLADLRNL